MTRIVCPLRRSSPGPIVLLALAGILALPSVAQAGTASVTGSTLRYAATAGEANQVAIELDAGEYVVSERGGVDAVVPGAGCSQGTDATVARCPATGITSLEVHGEDGGDELDASALTLPALLDGGTGNDRLAPGRGQDRLVGGEGTDEVVYWSRTARVVASLDGAANDGEAGEDDHIHGDVEELEGGEGDDVLTGSAGWNWLAGRQW